MKIERRQQRMLKRIMRMASAQRSRAMRELAQANQAELRARELENRSLDLWRSSSAQTCGDGAELAARMRVQSQLQSLINDSARFRSEAEVQIEMARETLDRKSRELEQVGKKETRFRRLAARRDLTRRSEQARELARDLLGGGIRIRHRGRGGKK